MILTMLNKYQYIIKFYTGIYLLHKFHYVNDTLPPAASICVLASSAASLAKPS